MSRSRYEGDQPIFDVLHVPYTYFPDASGGTEVYVRALAQRLSACGYPSAVAAPGAAPAAYLDGGLRVYRFPSDVRPRRELAYGVPDEIAAEGFGTIVAQARPDIVHLHALTAAVSERLVDVAHAAGARVVFTYHTPTASCSRGTMMLFGKTPCDGVIESKRCTACALSGLGVPQILTQVAAAIPDAVYTRAMAVAGHSKSLSMLQMPGFIGGSGRRFLDFVGKVDHVVAVSQWVSEVLKRNGVPAGKITLSRQGIVMSEKTPRPMRRDHQAEPLKIAYFGRIDRTKGPDLLVRALKIIPGADVRIDIFAIRQSAEPDRDYEWLETQARRDRRVNLRASISPEKVIGLMTEYDLIAVPSRWLETGPLVAFEAFAAGVPVLGANLGGIAELVRDGVDGILVAPDDPVAWAATIRRLANDRHVIDVLRTGIAPPRTMDGPADDMAKLYAHILPRESS
jgi:glycosyltransferase involved in cell wall biosynthesis